MILRQIGHTAVAKAVTLAGRLLLLYLLARTFAPADYGAYALVMTTTSFGVFLLGLNVYAFLYREAPGRAPADRIALFKTTFLFEVTLASAVLVAFVASGALPPALALVGASAYQTEFIIGLGLLLALIAAAEVQHYLWAKTDIEAGNYLDVIAQAAWVLPVGVLWTIQGSVTLTQVLGWNVVGVLAAVAYGFCRIEVGEWGHARVDRSVIATALRYSVPMIVPAVSFYALKLADRYVLSFYGSLTDVGLYSFAYTFFNTIYAFTATVILNVILPHVIQAQNRQELHWRNRLLIVGTKAAMVAFVGAAAAFLLVSRYVVEIFARPEYDAARSVMPLLAAGFTMVIVAYPAHYLLMLANRTRTIMWIDLAGLLLGMGGLLVLVPRFSYHGAALATLVGFAAVAVAKHLSCRSWESLDFRSFLTVTADVRAFGNLLRDRSTGVAPSS